MPVPFWKTKGKGRPKADGSSASESGDSPTSTASPQSQIPDPIDDSHSGQPSSSQRNDSSVPGIAPSIPKKTEPLARIDKLIQPVAAIDYRPPASRDLAAVHTSKPIYNGTVPNAQTGYDDLFNRNALDTFKFGSPSISTMTDTSSQVDPHSSLEEFPHPGADTTPRPSLAVHPEGIRGRLPPVPPVPSSSHPYPGTRHRPGRSDASSAHTFGTTTSASASVSSLVNPSSNDLSRTRQEDVSQEQSSDDEPHIRYYHPPSLGSLPSLSSVDSTYSREEFYYYDDEDLSDPDIGPAHQDDSDSFDESYWNIPPDQDSFVADYLSQRRGSNPIPIPGVQDGHSQGREREDSVATIKYPLTSAPGPSRMDRMSLSAVASGSTSLPAPDAAWDQRVYGRRDSPTAARSYPPILAMDYGSAPPPHFVQPFEPLTSHPDNDNVAMDFDPLEWGNIASGIKGGADLGDVDAAPLGAENVHTLWSRFGPNDAPRRPSVASTIYDTFQKHALAFKDQDWSFRKDKADGSALAKKKRNTFIPFNERHLKRGPPWRGMTIGQMEYWRNELTGMYKVERLEIPAGENRPPQQRLSIHHQRDGTRQAQRPIPGLLYDPHNGPTTTIHKHSKAAAFSLSRHYRDKSQSKSAGRQSNQARVQPLRNAVYINGKKTGMILLAPRKVQEAYTSTTTTRKLESHGLLGDAHRSRDIERWKRLVEEDDRHKEKQKMKEKVKREKELEKQKKLAEDKARKDKGKAKSRGQESFSDLTSQIETGVSNISVNPTHTASATSSVVPIHAAPDGDTPAAQSQVSSPSAPPLDIRNNSSASSSTALSGEPSTPPRVPVQAPADPSTSEPPTATVHPARTRPNPSQGAPQLQHSPSVVSGHTLLNPPETHPLPREQHFFEQEEEIDEEDEKIGLVPRRRKRTPHNEAYHSLSPESIDSFAAQQDSHSRSFLPYWFSGRNASSRTLKYEAPYNPPWLSAPSRPNNHDMQMQVVAGLNTSFQGVGLLPTDKEIRESRRRRAMKTQGRESARTERKYSREKDIFIDLPDDALYMLLPLWPAETDPVSNRDHPFDLPAIPIHERLYALVYYKPWYPPDTSGKGKNKDKPKRSRGSPTASQDGIFLDERNVLMNQFYIGARIVAYDDLEGSNVRVPELGLSVVGPLEESLATIPINKYPPRPRKGDKKGKRKDNGEEKEFWDFIIGSYHSRDHPMEFYPEGFKRMGLATQEDIEPVAATEAAGNHIGPSRLGGIDPAAPSGSGSSASGSASAMGVNASVTSLPSIAPGSASRVSLNEIAPFGEPGPSDNSVPLIRFPHNSEEEPILEPPIILTPIGRAVLEMAFMGALAVTGFAPQPYW